MCFWCVYAYFCAHVRVCEYLYVHIKEEKYICKAMLSELVPAKLCIRHEI